MPDDVAFIPWLDINASAGGCLSEQINLGIMFVYFEIPGELSRHSQKYPRC